MFGCGAWITLGLYVLFLATLWYLKPGAMFDKQTGQAKPFGLGDGKSCCAVPCVAIAAAIVLFALVKTGQMLIEK